MSNAHQIVLSLMGLNVLRAHRILSMIPHSRNVEVAQEDNMLVKMVSVSAQLISSGLDIAVSNAIYQNILILIPNSV